MATGGDAGHPHVVVDGPARRWVAPVGVRRFVAVEPGRGSGPLAVAPVHDAVAAADAASRDEHGADAARSDGLVAVPPEVHVRLTEAGSGPARLAWLDRLAHELRLEGVTGTLRRPRRQDAAEETLLAWMASRSVVTFLGARGSAPAGALVRPVLAAVPRPGATAWLGLGDAGFPQPDDEQLDVLLDRLVSSEHHVEARLEPHPGQATDLAWTGPARLSVRRYGPDHDWRQDLEQSRRLLEAMAAALDVGLARRDTPAAEWGGLHQGTPSPPAGDLALTWQLSPELWPRLVMDAHGLQLLTRDHLDLATDLSGWSVRAVGDRYLVEARDADPWFAGDEVAPDALAQARADFGTMIATEEQLTAHRRETTRRR